MTNTKEVKKIIKKFNEEEGTNLKLIKFKKIDDIDGFFEVKTNHLIPINTIQKLRKELNENVNTMGVGCLLNREGNIEYVMNYEEVVKK